MTRVLALLVAAAVALTLALAAGTASADVHGVSQAGCAANGAPSGASQEQSRTAPGRPAAPIPVTASDGKHQGKGGDGDPFCDVPPGPPNN
jgi:anti-sigma factor RsiW